MEDIQDDTSRNKHELLLQLSKAPICRWLPRLALPLRGTRVTERTRRCSKSLSPDTFTLKCRWSTYCVLGIVRDKSNPRQADELMHVTPKVSPAAPPCGTR